MTKGTSGVLNGGRKFCESYEPVISLNSILGKGLRSICPWYILAHLTLVCPTPPTVLPNASHPAVFCRMHNCQGSVRRQMLMPPVFSSTAVGSIERLGSSGVS